jgi:hypothetical protein
VLISTISWEPRLCKTVLPSFKTIILENLGFGVVFFGYIFSFFSCPSFSSCYFLGFCFHLLGHFCLLYLPSLLNFLILSLLILPKLFTNLILFLLSFFLYSFFLKCGFLSFCFAFVSLISFPETNNLVPVEGRPKTLSVLLFCLFFFLIFKVSLNPAALKLAISRFATACSVVSGYELEQGLRLMNLIDY